MHGLLLHACIHSATCSSFYRTAALQLICTCQTAVRAEVLLPLQPTCNSDTNCSSSRQCAVLQQKWTPPQESAAAVLTAVNIGNDADVTELDNYRAACRADAGNTAMRNS